LSDSAASFRAGTLDFEEQRVIILTGDRFGGFPTDGVIGYSILGHYAVEIDYDTKRMTLYEADAFSPGEGWQSFDIYFKANEIPWIEISMTTAGEEPIQLSAYIDFASGEALELLERQSNSFTLPDELKDGYIGRGLSGDIHGKEGRVSRVILGPFDLRDVVVTIVPAKVRSQQDGADAIIGNDLLRRFNIIFDYTHHKVHLKTNSSLAEPFE
jgi:hypothetical protein